MRRFAYWTAVVIALAALGAGSWYGYDAYRSTSGPDAAVRGYFAALVRGDAPAALAFGTVPGGPHDLLTSEVLAQQQQIAPMHDVRILQTTQDGTAATVRFSYRLRFTSGDQRFTGSLALTEGNSGWRLSRVAVLTSVTIGQAQDRFTFAGSSVPDGSTLMFPGALPVRFDTPNLQIDRSTAAVRLEGSERLEVTVEPTAVARASLTRHLSRLLATCLTAQQDAADCPTPSARVVPGSLRGALVGALAPKLTFAVGSQSSGTIELSARVVVAGSYQALSYDNIATRRSGRVALVVQAQAPAWSTALPVRFTVASS